MRTYGLVRLPLAASAAAVLLLAACVEGDDGIVVRVPDASMRDSGTSSRDAAADATKEDDDASVLADADVPDTSVDVDADVPDTGVEADAELPDATVDVDAALPDATVEIDAALPDAEVRIDRDRDRWFEDEDCDDNDPTVFPGAAELCDGLDNDCDEDIDEGVVALPWYLDGDGDGWGTTSRIPIFSCATVEGRTLVVGDCNDSDDAINPVATEVCNAADDDCDGFVDEGLSCGGDLLDISPFVTIDLSGTTDGITRSWDSADVTARVSKSGGPSGTLECRSGKVRSDGTLAGSFATCSGSSFAPYHDLSSGGDGLYRLEVRLNLGGGEVSDTLKAGYYLHASLEGARACEGVAADAHTHEEWFAAAAKYLPTTHDGATATFSTTAARGTAGAARIANPFLDIRFTPQNNSVFAFGGSAPNPWTNTTGQFDALSLRKHMYFNEDQTYVLIERQYEGRISPDTEEYIGSRDLRSGCSFSGPRYAARWGMPERRCDVIVMNREGAGVCLVDYGSGTIDQAYGARTWSELAMSVIGLTDDVDNAMWRKLGSRLSPQFFNTDEASYRAAVVEARTQQSLQYEACNADPSNWRCYYAAMYGAGGLGSMGYGKRVGWRHFSPKCFGDASCTSELDSLQSAFETRGPTLFLPDANHYGYAF